MAPTIAPILRVGRNIWYTLRPLARMATTSLSEERRLKPTRVPIRNEKGTVKIKIVGKSERTT